MECYGLDMMCTIYDDNVMDMMDMMAMLWIGYDVGWGSWMVTNELDLLIIMCVAK